MRSNVARPIVDDVAMMGGSSASRMTAPSGTRRNEGKETHDDSEARVRGAKLSEVAIMAVVDCYKKNISRLDLQSVWGVAIFRPPQIRAVA